MIVTAEITLSRIINDEGKMVWQVKTPDDYNSIELLGLLAAGLLHVFNEINAQS